MNEKLTLGFSPCPNDTYIFYGLVHNRIPLRGISFAPPLLEDVETLNSWAMQGRLDVTKLSFHALGHVVDDYVMLSAGAALGRGCGPLLVSRSGSFPDPGAARVAVPGRYTTAAMLLKLFAPQVANQVVMRFEEIMPAVRDGRVDAGVIIHESRFTYQQFGLAAIVDLGQWWEEVTGLPIPLGCIAVKRTFPGEIIEKVQQSVRSSLQWANSHPREGMDYIRRHAQEMEEKVLQNHIGLYVNDFSLDMGKEGFAAVKELFRRGRQAGIFPPGANDEMVGCS